VAEPGGVGDARRQEVERVVIEDPPPGRERAVERALGPCRKSGDMQPLAEEWNPAGYQWNVTPRMGVEVVKELGGRSQPAETPPPRVAPPAQFRNACLACHEEDMIRQQRLTRIQWGREIDKMVRWGSPVKPEDRGGILDYLSANFGILRPKL